MLLPKVEIIGEDEPYSYVLTQQQLERMITELLPNYGKYNSWYLDNYYRAMPVNQFGKLLSSWHDLLKMVNYKQEIFDCDDYAFAFSAFTRMANYPCGIVIGEFYYKETYLGYHAWNILLFCNPSWKDVLQSFRLYEFEPQIGEILLGHKSSDGFRYVGRWVIW